MAGLFGWGARRSTTSADPAPPAPSDDPTIRTKVLPRVLSTLAAVDAPALLNLGPVIGQNVTFFGDRLACRLSIEDLYVPVDDQAVSGSAAALPEIFEARLPAVPGTFDGILCWDLFDFLNKGTSQRLAARLVSLLRPGGVLYGFFGTTATAVSQHTRFIVEAADTLRLRPVVGPRLERHVLLNRDLNKIFDGLTVSESILLKMATRETLFRKS